MPFYYQVPHYCGIYYIPHTTVHTKVTPSWLPQASLSITSKLYDTSSRTVLTQTFVNPLKNVAIEKAKYNFPLYENCAVVAFRCFVGKRLIEGVVKGKEEAKTHYNEAVARGETAALLEQHAPDVFRTSLGNIPAGETVKVEVEYIMELKHDAEVDGLRFTIPTSIAPRYGEAPSGMATYSDGQPIPGALAKGGVKISIQITMPSNIRAVQSPSHPISMHLGGHIENFSDDAFNPKHALATLSQTSAELGADFVLLVKCADLSSPRALLETHPTIPNSKALMVTLVPKFTLPPGPKPEVVFVVDRSGSMDYRMEPLKSALGVFLKSLPVGVKFNICSFGSSHSFLWKKSKSYSAITLEQAQKHVELMDSDLGGTEILPPIKSTVSRRYKDLPLEIMVLTDGEVWDTGPLFEYIEKETATGDVRLFSLGIGQDVSHALVEGMARVGRGFAQIVSDEKEGMEGKVVRMLRGGLSAHINDYRLEWHGRLTEEQAQTLAEGKSASSFRRVVEGVKRKINLFDTEADTDAPIDVDRFADLPEFVVPSVLQTPYKIPPLFPFSRSTVYVILSGVVAPPSSVWLRGTTPSGDELELEIAVQILSDHEQTIHQLAARKLLQELEEGTGYLHSGHYGVDKVKNAGTFGDWVEREGIRVGVGYGLASKWTSFVAVEKQDEKGVVSLDDDHAQKHELDVESVTEGGDDNYLDYSDCEEDEEMDCDLSDSEHWNSRAKTKPSAGKAHSASQRWLDVEAEVEEDDDEILVHLECQEDEEVSEGFLEDPAVEDDEVVKCGRALRYRPYFKPGPEQHVATLPPQVSPVVMSIQPQTMASPKKSWTPAFAMKYQTKKIAASHADKIERGPLSDVPSFDSGLLTGIVPADASSSSSSGTGAPLLAAREQARALIALQTFEGSFPLTMALASVLEVSLTNLEAKLMEFVPVAGNGLLELEKKNLWATVLAVFVFEGKLIGEKGMWELVVEKARAWIAGLAQVGDVDAERLAVLAREMLCSSMA